MCVTLYNNFPPPTATHVPSLWLEAEGLRSHSHSPDFFPEADLAFPNHSLYGSFPLFILTIPCMFIHSSEYLTVRRVRGRLALRMSREVT